MSKMDKDTEAEFVALKERVELFTDAFTTLVLGRFATEHGLERVGGYHAVPDDDESAFWHMLEYLPVNIVGGHEDSHFMDSIHALHGFLGDAE